MADLDYAGVSRFWSKARPSILGPYMMDGFGFPGGAGRFRFQGESRIVSRLIGKLDGGGAALDLGCGVGYWAEHFAGHFAKVVAVEASLSLYEATRRRCESRANVVAVHGDVLAFEPEDHYQLVFLGGLLMYLNQSDVISLLRKLVPHATPIIAAAFFVAYLLSFAWGGIWWGNQNTSVASTGTN